MYRVHEEMVTYQTNGQTFADFCFKWATPTQPSVQLPIKIVQTMDHKEICIFNQAPEYLEILWFQQSTWIFLEERWANNSVFE